MRCLFKACSELLTTTSEHRRAHMAKLETASKFKAKLNWREQQRSAPRETSVHYMNKRKEVARNNWMKSTYFCCEETYVTSADSTQTAKKAMPNTKSANAQMLILKHMSLANAYL